MELKSIEVTVHPYRLRYSIVLHGTQYGLRVAEFCEGEAAKEKMIPNLTEDEQEIFQLQALLAENRVFVNQTEEILEDVGYEL